MILLSLVFRNACSVGDLSSAAIIIAHDTLSVRAVKEPLIAPGPTLVFGA
jgi:hypothetical protein